MKVSVLIPVYNVEVYVELAILSIINQTYQNLEIIIVDDCSTDKTFEKCLCLSKFDSRIRLYKNESNKKISSTLNRAYHLSTGELIARMDGDDVSEPDRIERLVKFLDENKKYDLVGCSVIAIDTSGNEIGRTTHYSQFEFLKRTSHFVSPCSHIWVARRTLYEKLNGYRDIPGAEDYDFLLRSIDEGHRITNLEDYFGYKVRLGRTGNTVSTIGARQRLLQKYVLNLHFQRMRLGKDYHSEELMFKEITQSILSEKLFKISNISLQIAIESKGTFRLPIRIATLLFSLISPIQAKYLASRIKYKLLCLKEKP